MYYFTKDLIQLFGEIHARHSARLEKWKQANKISPQEIIEDLDILPSSVDIKNKLNDLIQKVVFTFCSRSERGVFEIPLHSLYYSYKETKLQKVCTKNNPLSRITFEGFTFGLKSNLLTQSVLLTLRTMKVIIIDSFLPSLSFFFNFHCII